MGLQCMAHCTTASAAVGHMGARTAQPPAAWSARAPCRSAYRCMGVPCS